MVQVTGVGADAYQVAVEPVDAPDSQRLLRAYLTDIAARYLGRPVSAAEVDQALAAHPSADLAPPDGLFLVLRWQARPVGVVGLRLMSPDTGEVKRLYVVPEARRRGAGRLLLAALERAAADRGLRALRLDTRSDLVEARALYAACGYREIAAYNTDPYAERWFEKVLAPPG